MLDGVLIIRTFNNKKRHSDILSVVGHVHTVDDIEIRILKALSEGLWSLFFIIDQVHQWSHLFCLRVGLGSL